MAFFADIDRLTTPTELRGRLAETAQMTVEVMVRTMISHGYATISTLLNLSTLRTKHSGIKSPSI